MNYCPFCKKRVEDHWSFCRHCNKPLIVNIKKKFTEIREYPIDGLTFNSYEESIEEENYDFYIIKDDNIERKIQEIDKNLEQKETHGELVGSLLLEKSSLYYKKRDFSTALKILEMALKNFGEENDLLNIAISHNEIGLIQEELGFFDEAIYHFDRTLENLKELKDNNKIVQVYNNLGNAYYLIKDLENSYKYYQEALKLAEREKMLFEEVKSSSNLVEILFLLKDHDRIAKILARNSDYFRKNEDLNGIINTLIKYGKLYYFLGEDYYDQSYESFNDALSLIEKIKEDITTIIKARLEWECFLYLGKLNLLWDNDVDAEDYLLKSLESIRIYEIRDDLKQGVVLEALGNLYEIKGENNKAIDFYKLSSEIYYQFGDDPKIAEISTKIAQIYLDYLDNNSKAIEYYNNALKVFEKLNFSKEAAETLNQLGDIAVNKGLIEMALLDLEQAKNYYEDIKDEYNIKLLVEKIKSLKSSNKFNDF